MSMRDILKEFDVPSISKEVDRPGEYESIIHSFLLKKSKAGNEMLVWTFKITEGPEKGNKVTKYSVLKNGVPRILEELNNMGIFLDKISDLEDHKHEIINAKVKIRVQINDRGKNVYILEGGDFPF